MTKQTEKLKSNESSFNEDPEHVHFYSDGLRLSGQFTRAKGPRVGQRSPTILCLHGYTGRKEDVKQIYSVVYRTVGEYHGSVSAEHGVGVQKLAYLHYSRTEQELALMRTLKQTMDPKAILNPGRVLP